MVTLDRQVLAEVTGGAAPRTWARVGVDYAKACGDGAITAATMAPPTPQTLAIGCAAGMAGQGVIDAVQWARARR